MRGMLEAIPARCILCGKLATHQAALLLVPSRSYAGKPWRVEVSGALVCGSQGCQKPLPDELLGVVDQLRASVGMPPFWDQLVSDIKAQTGRAGPHKASTRAAYAPLEPRCAEESFDALPGQPGEN